MPVKGYDAEAFEWRGINADGTPDEAMLERLRTAIVDAVEPERIILFGSAARGDMRAKSDLDVLVVRTGGIVGDATENLPAAAARTATRRPDRSQQGRGRGAQGHAVVSDRTGTAGRAGAV